MNTIEHFKIYIKFLIWSPIAAKNTKIFIYIISLLLRYFHTLHVKPFLAGITENIGFIRVLCSLAYTYLLPILNWRIHFLSL